MYAVIHAEDEDQTVIEVTSWEAAVAVATGKPYRVIERHGIALAQTDAAGVIRKLRTGP
jgi:hypothetical protein